MFAVTLLLPIDERATRSSLARTKNSSAQRAPSRREELWLPVLIVSLSYCSTVSVLLNPRFVDLEHHVANKAARRISLVKLLCVTSCLVFPFCTIGNPRFWYSAESAIGIGDRWSMFVSLAFKSRQCPRSPCGQQYDPDSSN